MLRAAGRAGNYGNDDKDEHVDDERYDGEYEQTPFQTLPHAICRWRPKNVFFFKLAHVIFYLIIIYKIALVIIGMSGKYRVANENAWKWP